MGTEIATTWPDVTRAVEALAMTVTELVLPFDRIDAAMIDTVGGKNASLGEMIRSLHEAGVRVPDGFAVTTDAFRLHLSRADLTEWICATLDELDVRDVGALGRVGREVRSRIEAAPLPAEVEAAVRDAYVQLCRGGDEVAVAVRSSATAEDLPTASFAGQQETYLNVRGAAALLDRTRACMASLYTDRAIVYRAERGIPHRGVALSVGVQRMVRSDLAGAGVAFTLDPDSGFRDVVLITAAWGLGETVVQGRVNPDEYWVHKPTARAGHRSVIRRNLGEKAIRMVLAEDSAKRVRELPVRARDRESFVLSCSEALEIARACIAIEDHESARAGHPVPMDVEWAKDGETNELFIVQARPETVHSSRPSRAIEVFRIDRPGAALIEGKSVGRRIGVGPARIVQGRADLDRFQDGDVLVAEMTDPDWEPILGRAAAVVTNQGGRTCHAAIVSRELGLPCVVGTKAATDVIEPGQVVTVSCAEGDVGRVYAGRVPFTRESIDPAAIPVSPVPLMLNVADPDTAFELGQLPSAGVGLLRIEFLVGSWIGIHPMALVHPDRVDDPGERAEIRRRTRGFDSPSEFFVDRLATGVAQIAAAFWPRPVIVRLSDFKTNEYARLLGGRGFEPVEANPMIGFRGASRYADPRYREGFALECHAIRRVREEMGLVNVKVMVPFCRTLAEGRRVLGEMSRHGLVRGQDDLEVWVMCEIPNNVVLADEFCELFDGFSIGSNDLTQLTLGIDRDSAILADQFDEQDPGVKRMIEFVVERAHVHARKVGICGQAPSDHPEFAEFLASIGIDSISLTPDSLPGVAARLARGRPAD